MIPFSVAIKRVGCTHHALNRRTLKQDRPFTRHVSENQCKLGSIARKSEAHIPVIRWLHTVTISGYIVSTLWFSLYSRKDSTTFNGKVHQPEGLILKGHFTVLLVCPRSQVTARYRIFWAKPITDRPRWRFLQGAYGKFEVERRVPRMSSFVVKSSSFMLARTN